MIDNSSPITSLQNARVKQVVALQQKSSERRKTGLFVVEGLREIGHCQSAGYEFDSIFWCKELCGGWHPTADVALLVNEVTPTVYAKMAYRDSTEGIMAVVRSRHLTLNDLRLPDDALLMVLESVEKPGNLGAILRSADAAGADAVIVCDPLTDLYNPNLIRASIGAAFTVPTVTCTSEECISFLKSRGIRILTAQLQDPLLRHRHASGRGHRHGHRVYRTHHSMARGSRCPHPYTHVRPPRLTQRVGQRGHPAL